MARSQRKYNHEYKEQAVKLAKEIGGAKAAKELGTLIAKRGTQIVDMLRKHVVLL